MKHDSNEAGDKFCLQTGVRPEVWKHLQDQEMTMAMSTAGWAVVHTALLYTIDTMDEDKKGARDVRALMITIADALTNKVNDAFLAAEQSTRANE